jgi:hypothetical protein
MAWLRKSTRRFVVAALGVLATLLIPAAATAQDRHYLWIFSSQSEPKLARYTHTWAAFARLRDGCGPRPFEAFAISWMPASLQIRPFAIRPEPGVHLDLPTTLRFVHCEGERISVWGPYEISGCLYEHAVRQKAHLESGQVQYRAIDPVIRRDTISDCIHAVSDIASDQTRLKYIETLFFGEAAGRRIAHAYRNRGLLCPPREDLAWAERALGMTCYPIIRRD